MFAASLIFAPPSAAPVGDGAAPRAEADAFDAVMSVVFADDTTASEDAIADQPSSAPTPWVASPPSAGWALTEMVPTLAPVVSGSGPATPAPEAPTAVPPMVAGSQEAVSTAAMDIVAPDAVSSEAADAAPPLEAGTGIPSPVLSSSPAPMSPAIPGAAPSHGPSAPPTGTVQTLTQPASILVAAPAPVDADDATQATETAVVAQAEPAASPFPVWIPSQQPANRPARQSTSALGEAAERAANDRPTQVASSDEMTEGAPPERSAALHPVTQKPYPSPDLQRAPAPIPPGTQETIRPEQAGSTVAGERLIFDGVSVARSDAATGGGATAATLPGLVAHMALKAQGGASRFELGLTPEGLGRVDVTLEIDADGQLAARLAFDNPLAAMEMRGRVDELRRQLEQAGFDLRDDALTFADRDPSAGQGFDRSPSHHQRSAYRQGRALLSEPAIEPSIAVTYRTGPAGLDMRV